MSALAAGRFRLAPALTAVVLTILLLWLFGTAAGVFLLLFIAVLISLYLSAGTDLIQRHTGMPRLGAFWITVSLMIVAIVALFWMLVPPVVVPVVVVGVVPVPGIVPVPGVVPVPAVVPVPGSAGGRAFTCLAA